MWRRRIRGPSRWHGPAELVPLAALRPGERAEVVSLNMGSSQRLQRLSTLGLVPGVELVLRQTWPTFIVRLGETELALDSSLANAILVKSLAPAAPRCARRRRGWRK